MTLRVYLGARYSRLAELRVYAADLNAMGFNADARWLTGELGDLVGATSNPAGDPMAAEAARHDTEDLLMADFIVIFTDPPEYQSRNGRGGFHVELGVGIGLYLAGKHVRLLLVGHRVNSFHHLPYIEFYPTWFEARAVLLKEASS